MAYIKATTTATHDKNATANTPIEYPSWVSIKPIIKNKYVYADSSK